MDGVGSISEVLVLRNVGINTAGTYSCVDGSDHTHDATLTVIGTRYMHV